MRFVWAPLGAIFLLLVCWHFSIVLFNIPTFLLPSPMDVLREVSHSWPRIKMHTLATVQLLLLGFIIGSSIGILFACVLHPFQWLKAAFNPLIVISQNVPIIVLGPLLITWFGLGLFPKILIITLVCFFPIVIAMSNGLTQTDKIMMNYMQMIGASRWQIFTKLELPHALPHLFSGLKISATYSMLGAVMAEWIGADRGIGKYLVLQQSAFRTDRMFIAIAIIIIISLLMFALIVLLERWLIRWRRSDAQ